jgi:hypothetical protein
MAPKSALLLPQSSITFKKVILRAAVRCFKAVLGQNTTAARQPGEAHAFRESHLRDKSTNT